MSHPLANYATEQTLFEDLLAANAAHLILLFRGGSGSGKTTLVNACLRRVPGDMWHIPFELKAGVTVAEIFRRVRRFVGWDRFPRFNQEVADLLGVPTMTVEKNQQEGSGNQINIALQGDNPDQREHRRAALTDAWFDDLVALPRPLLLSLDSYEQTNSDVRDWVEGSFLATAPQVPTLRVLLAGQQTPEPHNIQWSHCCAARDLYGVQDATAWLPVAQAMGCRLDVADPLTWLAGVCAALKGNPAEIVKFLESLIPQRGRP